MAGNFFDGEFFGGGFFGANTSDDTDKHDGWRREKRQDKGRSEEFRRSKEQLREDIEGAWEAITASGEPAVIREAIQIAKPAITKAARRVRDVIPKPNFDVLSQFRLRQLMALHQELQDEEEILMFMDDD